MTLSRRSVAFAAFLVICCNPFISEIAVGALVSNVNNHKQPAKEGGIHKNKSSLLPQSDIIIYVGNLDWKLPIADVSSTITKMITTNMLESERSADHNGAAAAAAAVGSFEVKVAELPVPRRPRDEGKFHRGSAEVIFSSPVDARRAMEVLKMCLESATSSGGSDSGTDFEEWKIRWAYLPKSSPLESQVPIHSLSQERIDHRKKRAEKYARKRKRIGEATDRAIESLLTNLCQADRDFLIGQQTPVLEAPLLDWSTCPDEIDPMRGGRIKKGTQRGERKRAAVEAFLEVARGLLVILDSAEQNDQSSGSDSIDTTVTSSGRPGRTVADLGCGAGNLTVPLAWWLKQLGFDVLGVDINDQALALLSKRADRLGIEIRTVHQDLLKLSSWKDEDLGNDGGNTDNDGCLSTSAGGNELSECAAVVSLHACGAASDLSMAAAVRNNLPFAVSPCCIGKISTERRPIGRMLPRTSLTSAERSAAPTAVVSYPRSVWLSKALPSQEDYRLLAAAADYGVGNSDKGDVDNREIARRKRCRLSKKIIEMDRLQWAKENGYCVRLLEMPRIGPLYPKRELLLGAKEGSRAASALLQLPTVL